MSFERDVNLAVQMMFKHTKAVVSKTLLDAVRRGDITIDESKLPGLDLLIGRAIDAGRVQSARQLNSVLTENSKKHSKK